jgi:WD40 repeat protein
MPAKDVYSWSSNLGVFLASGGYDGLVKFFKIDRGMTQQIGETNLFKPVHYMSGQYPLLVTAHSEKFINFWNLDLIQQQFTPIGVRESPLKFATSSICCFADGRGYAVGSIEGRCGIVNIKLNEPDAEIPSDFCFRCHRVDDDQESKVHTVNGISFNKKFNTFASIGSDGNYTVWNKDTKSKYKYSKNPAPLPMTAVCFSEDA